MLVLLRCPDKGSCSYSLGFLRTILSIVLTSAPIRWWHPHFCFPLCVSLFGSRFTCLFTPVSHSHLKPSTSQSGPIITNLLLSSVAYFSEWHHHPPLPVTNLGVILDSHNHQVPLVLPPYCRMSCATCCPTVHRIRVLLHTAFWDWHLGLSFNCFPDNWAITWWRFLVRSVSILDGNVITQAVGTCSGVCGGGGSVSYSLAL